MKLLSGTDVVPKLFDQILQRAAVAETAPLPAPYRVMREDALADVVVYEPYLAAVIDFHAGVAIYWLAIEEPAAVVGDDPDHLVDLFTSLAHQGEFVFCGHGDNSSVYSVELIWGRGVMICALCKEEKGKLIDSHFMPAAAYQHVRGAEETRNGSPVLINIGRKSAFQTDKQIKQPLLCGGCEDLFSRNGEKKMGQLWATKAEFPLLDLLNSKALVSKGIRFDTYDSRLLDQCVVDAVFYFAVSIFWRAQVWDWGRNGDAYRRALGDIYESQFRLFLLGHEKLEDVLLLVDVNSNLDTLSVMSFPTCVRMGADRLHSFSLLGLKFTMYVGRSISSMVRAPFKLYDSQTMFISSDLTKSPAFWKLAERVQTKVVAKGKLARSPQ